MCRQRTAVAVVMRCRQSARISETSPANVNSHCTVLYYTTSTHLLHLLHLLDVGNHLESIEILVEND